MMEFSRIRYMSKTRLMRMRTTMRRKTKTIKTKMMMITMATVMRRRATKRLISPSL